MARSSLPCLHLLNLVPHYTLKGIPDSSKAPNPLHLLAGLSPVCPLEHPSPLPSPGQHLFIIYTFNTISSRKTSLMPPSSSSPQFQLPTPFCVLTFGEIIIAIFRQLFVHNLGFISSACFPKGARGIHPGAWYAADAQSIGELGRPSLARRLKCGLDHRAEPAGIFSAASTVPLGTPLALYSRTLIIESKCSLQKFTLSVFIFCMG